ncbi:MAG: hypoxanthine phosphoribosyltransferase [Magnetococcales bacterium]|nr:hypoxanthine phosphoribosyltransferase [Magnetococcales bacterium]
MSELTPENAKVEPLINEAEIKTRIKTMAKEIAPHMEKNVVVVGLLKGAYVFTADLVRELARLGVVPIVDFMVLSSYGKSTESSGTVEVKLDCEEDLSGRQVLLLDDILDSGRTLSFAVDHLEKLGASSVLTAVLLDKPSRRNNSFTADFSGFTIDNLFVVGYGIDFAEHFREHPYVGFVKQ